MAPLAQQAPDQTLRTLMLMNLIPRATRSGRRGLAVAALLAVCAGCSTGTASTGSTSSDAPLADKLPQSVQDKGELVLATSAEFPPCEYYPPGSSKMEGFEPDLWNAMGEKLGVPVNAVSIQFAGLIPGVQGGRFDLAMECISDKPERQAQVTLLDFMYAEVGVVIGSDNPKKVTEDPLTLCGLKGGAATGTINRDRLDMFAENCKKNGKATVTPVEFPEQGQVLLALQSGRIDFLTQDHAAAEYISKQSNFPVTILPSPLIPRQYIGIAIAKENKELQDAMLAALKAIHEDGTYDKVLEKWNLTDLALDEPGFNLATSRPIPTSTP
jgi:polar amino acid transport system substrate-binding protein